MAGLTKDVYLPPTVVEWGLEWTADAKLREIVRAFRDVLAVVDTCCLPAELSTAAHAALDSATRHLDRPRSGHWG